MKLAASLLLSLSLIGTASLADTRAGYYYPDITTNEEFQIRLGEDAASSSNDTRIEFITDMASRQRERNYPPRITIFTKGHDARRLIIVAMDNEVFETLYRARAMLAELTSEARSTPLLRDRNMQTLVTFFDVLTMLGFKEVTLSDGKTWTHRIDFVERVSD
ncbi:MAG: hypothetical protein AAGC81_07420 [Pseudomonadota bacterium]